MALNSHTEYGEVDFATHRVADRTDFLEKMFPISNEMINRILNKVAESGDYKNDCWFPVSEENTLGQCFVKAANAIHSAAIASRNDSNEAVAGAKWMEYSSARQAGDMPVILARRQAQAQCDIDILPKSDHNDEGDSSNHQLFSWLQALAAVEMRRKASQNDGEMVTQLLGHLRRIMQKQLDRRFVFGLAVEPAHITVWLYDRSGAIGTSESVDIHQNPKDFIHVMAGFALLPMHQLGFDTTMRFYASPNNVFHTFDLDAGGLRVYLDTASTEKQWVITCNDGRQYLTVRVLCLNSHCLVWVVVPFGSGEITSNDLRVLKQYWRLDHPNTMSERELLVETFGDNVSGRIEFEETVKINGEEDITATLIRHDIQVAMPASSEDKNLRRAWDDDSKSYYLTRIRGLGYWDDMSCVQATPIGPMARIHTRVMQTIFGWPLDTFKTLRELVQGALDVVIDHATLYNKGLLHRDISSGNILLTWCNGTSGTTGLGTQGRLIDFDRSRRGEKSAEGLLPDVYLDDPQLVVASLSSTLRNDAGIKRIDLSVANRALEVIPVAPVAALYTLDAVRHTKNHRPVDERVSSITTDMLLWKPTTFPLYRFDSDECKRAPRTGTLPFTSAEILSSERIFNGTSSVPFFHDAIHDMESMLWVLSYIGMTRCGPDTNWRVEMEDLTPEREDPDRESLHTALYYLFEGKRDEVRRSKLKMFMNSEEYKTDVTGHFHEYFAALKPFMEEWFDLLVLAYKHVNGHEYRSIHYQVEHILRRALESLPLDEATQKEVMESRLKDLEGMVRLGAEAQCTQEDARITRDHDLAFQPQTFDGPHLDRAPSTSSPPPRKKAKV